MGEHIHIDHEDEDVDNDNHGASMQDFQLKMELPVLLITNGVLLPEARLKIPIRSKANLAMLDRFVLNKSSTAKTLILVAYRIEGEKKPHPIGTVALVEQVVYWQYNNHVQYSLHLLGVSRAKIVKFGMPICEIKQLYDVQGELNDDVKKTFLLNCKKLASILSTENLELTHTLQQHIKEERLDALTDCVVAQIHEMSYTSLLDYLSNLNVAKRVETANGLLTALFKNSQPNEENTKNPLQLVIEDLLPVKGMRRIKGTSSGKKLDANNDLEQKLTDAQLPDHISERVMQDLDRLKKLGPNSQEYHVLSTYLELVASLPWSKSTQDDIDVAKARKLLEDSHEGMVEVKKRVLEYLAVTKLNGNVGGPILCFAGAPGIGKTSIAKAIAQSLGRKFERISLGGIRDESDIRGHRRTYVAAMPGRIIQAIKHAGTNNPVILLDEIDKLYSGVHGSPSAALLETLDPEQNNTFVDHYLSLPFDLSNVIFVATANDLSTVEGPLLDRMETIEMSGYSTMEKVRIAEKHVIPRQISRNGVQPDYVTFKSEALHHIIDGYTREAGVRELERVVGSVCRHVALTLAEAFNWDCTTDVVSNLQLPIVIDKELVETIRGPPKFSRVDLVAKMKSFRPGVCFGLAWTPFGGELMLIETSICKGKGKVVMTGKLGDVLRESVEVARSWIRANSHRFNLLLPADGDLHVHLPAGAVGKDGPSAGCALVASLFSLASNRNVRNDTAVTGEISLTGQVLPVGGIKEKILGAHRAGLRRVILPEANRTDVHGIEEQVKKEMTIDFVSEIDELIEKLIEKNGTIEVLSKL